MQPANPPLDQPAQARELPWKIFRAVLGVALWLLVAWLVCVSIPRAERLFAEFHMVVPLAAKLTIQFRWAVPVLAALSFAICIYARKRWAWLWVLIVLPAILTVTIFATLYIPITALLQGMYGKTDGWLDVFLL